MATVEDVTDVLRDVIDPELGLDFVELGLIYDVEVEGSTVLVTYTLTSPGCPIGPQVAEQIDEFVTELEGVTSVASEMTFSPPWTPERMSEDAKFALVFGAPPAALSPGCDPLRRTTGAFIRPEEESQRCPTAAGPPG